MRVPNFELLYECDITLLEPQNFGATFEGKRRIFPIAGGQFQGPALQGTVLSGGVDWNLLRADEATCVQADYYLRTHDGVTLRMLNKGVGGDPPVDHPDSGERFFMYTTPAIEAPTGKYDWLNRSMLIGTLGARRNVKNAVLVRVFKLV